MECNFQQAWYLHITNKLLLNKYMDNERTLLLNGDNQWTLLLNGHNLSICRRKLKACWKMIHLQCFNHSTCKVFFSQEVLMVFKLLKVCSEKKELKESLLSKLGIWFFYFFIQETPYKLTRSHLNGCSAIVYFSGFF